MRLFLIILLFLSGCTQPESVKQDKIDAWQASIIARATNSLPNGATDIVHKGNLWIEFKLDGHKYLYRLCLFSNSQSECITKVE